MAQPADFIDFKFFYMFIDYINIFMGLNRPLNLVLWIEL